MMIAMDVQVCNFFMASGIIIGYSHKNMGLSGDSTHEIGESGKMVCGSVKREDEPVKPVMVTGLNSFARFQFSTASAPGWFVRRCWYFLRPS